MIRIANWRLDLFTFLLLLSPFMTNSDLFNIKDPFIRPVIISCDELATQLIYRIKLWQYQGNMSSKQSDLNTLFIVWLTDQKEWLSVSHLNQLTPLMPWQIEEISPYKIQWQTTLPDYCHKQLVFTMPFGGDKHD